MQREGKVVIQLQRAKRQGEALKEADGRVSWRRDGERDARREKRRESDGGVGRREVFVLTRMQLGEGGRRAFVRVAGRSGRLGMGGSGTLSELSSGSDGAGRAVAHARVERARGG